VEFDKFIDAVKQVRSVPTDYLLGRLSAAVQSGSGVHATFFASQPATPAPSPNAAADQPALDQLSVLYLSYVLGRFTGFGFAGTVHNAEWPNVQSWFTQYSSTVGQDMMIDYLKQDAVLGGFFNDGPATAAEIADHAASNDFLTGLLVECDTLGTDLPPKVFLLALRLMDDDGPSYKRVLQAWVVNDRWSKDLEGFDRYPWLDGLEPQFNQGGPTYNAVYQAVSAACSASTSYHHMMPGVWVQGALTMTPPRDFIHTTYGPAVQQWLNSASGPAVYGLRSASPPQNTTDVPVDTGGCVIAGTPILLADGTTKCVEEIVEGDEIVSGTGVVSVASAELVANDRITTLYSFNDDPVFMSLEHAVMTQRGWCSLAPGVTQDFAPHHTVSQLRTGDVVWRLCHCDQGTVEYEKVVVERINVEQFAPGTAPRGYDLHLRGHASYHAHGYCTLCCYPEITTQRIASNVLTRMSVQEQLQLEKTLVEIEPMLSKTLGEGVVAQVASVFGDLKSSASRAAHTDVNGVNRRPVVGTEHLVVPRLQVVPVPGSTVAPDLEELAVTHGTLSVGGRAVESRAHGRHLYWKRATPAGTTETGVLRFASHGLIAHGAVNYGGTTQLFTALGMVAFTTTYGANATPWCEVQMGFTRDDKGLFHATGMITDPAKPSGDADLQKHSTVVFSVIQSPGREVFHATVSIDPAFCQFGGSTFIGAEIDFTSDYSHFTGTLYPFAVDQPGYRGTGVALTGTCTDLAHLQQLLGGTTAAMLRMPLASDRLAAAPATAAAAHPLVLAASPMLDSLEMSAQQLFDLPTPDMSMVQGLAFAKMRSLMLLAVARREPEWLSFLGETAPPVGAGQTITSADASLLDNETNSNFLVDRFAVGYLTQAFRTSNDKNIEAAFASLTSADDKLGYFWKGAGKTSFAKDPGYAAMTSQLLDSAYRDSVPELQPYLAGDRVSWAQQLYDYCTTEPTLTGLAMQNTLDGRQQLTHLTTLLHTLDPAARVQKDNGKAVSLATSLWERVMDVRLNEIVTYTTPADPKDYVEFLTEFFRQYFASLLTDTWADEIRSQASKELADLMAEYAVDNTNALVDKMSDIIVQAVDVLINAKGTMPARIQAWAEANPKLSKGVSTALSLGVYGFGIFQSIETFMDWEDLNPSQRTAAVTGVLQITVSMFNDVAKFQAARTLASAEASMDEVMAAAGEIQDAARLNRLTVAADRIGIELDIELGDLAAPGIAAGGGAAGAALTNAENLVETATRWTKVANITEIAAHGMTVVALAAGCVATGFQIQNDFDTGQPPVIKAFDILEEISGGVAFMVEGVVTIAAIVGVEVLSAIPVVGEVAAVIGVIIAFVMLFIHRNPPPTPQELFVAGQSIPFVTALDLPPADWVAAQKKVAQHLGGEGTSTMAPLLV